MIEWLSALPTGWMYAGFFLLGVVRGLGYYGAGALGRRVRRSQSSEAIDRGVSAVRRWGAGSVIVTYPFYGLAAATQVASGVARVPLLPYAGALAFVSSLWAALQTALGVAVLEALAAGAWPWVVGLIAVLVLAGVVRSRLAPHVQ